MSTKAGIAVPTLGGLTDGLTNYAVGLFAGIGYRMISRFTGSGLIGGAIAAAVTSAVIRGPAGAQIATITGFTTGQQSGLGGLGLGNLGGILGNGDNGGPKIELLNTI